MSEKYKGIHRNWDQLGYKVPGELTELHREQITVIVENGLGDELDQLVAWGATSLATTRRVLNNAENTPLKSAINGAVTNVLAEEAEALKPIVQKLIDPNFTTVSDPYELGSLIDSVLGIKLEDSAEDVRKKLSQYLVG